MWASLQKAPWCCLLGGQLSHWGMFPHKSVTKIRRSIMRRLTTLWIIVCVGLLFAPAGVLGAGLLGELDVKVVNTAVYRFAGFSSTTTNGDTGGIGGMHSICQVDLGDNSARMCTTKELLLSPNVPSGSSLSPAWVQPTIVTTVNQTHYDYSGSPYVSGTCFQWTHTFPKGMAFAPKSSAGFVGVIACKSKIKVACCKPIK